MAQRLVRTVCKRLQNGGRAPDRRKRLPHRLPEGLDPARTGEPWDPTIWHGTSAASPAATVRLPGPNRASTNSWSIANVHQAKSIVQRVNASRDSPWKLSRAGMITLRQPMAGAKYSKGNTSIDEVARVDGGGPIRRCAELSEFGVRNGRKGTRSPKLPLTRAACSGPTIRQSDNPHFNTKMA